MPGPLRKATVAPPTCEVRVLGYLPIADMLALRRRAMVNCYLTCDQTFHHRVVELLCCGRPILCFPPDQAEALTLTQRVVAICARARRQRTS